MVTRLDSSHVFHRMTRLVSSHSQWLETRVRVIFAKSLSLWWANPIRLHTKKWTFFASVMIKIGGNFLLWLSSCAMLHFKYQVYPTCVEAGLRLCFHSGVSRGTIYWHLIVTPYRDTLSWHLIDTLSPCLQYNGSRGRCSICISSSWQWVSYCDLVSFPDTNKVI